MYSGFNYEHFLNVLEVCFGTRFRCSMVEARYIEETTELGSNRKDEETVFGRRARADPPRALERGMNYRSLLLEFGGALDLTPRGARADPCAAIFREILVFKQFLWLTLF